MIRTITLLGFPPSLRLLLRTLLVVMSVVSSVYAQSATQMPNPNLGTIRALMEKPDDQIDLAKAKLIIDRMIDPSIDTESNLKRLDAMAQKIKAMLHQSVAYRDLMEQEFVRQYQSPSDIPLGLRARYVYLGRNMDMWRQKAEAIGWRIPDEVSEANYRQTVQRVKANQ